MNNHEHEKSWGSRQQREMEAVIQVAGLSKGFVLHQQGGVQISVFNNLHLRVKAGESVALLGPSGSGKSSLLRCLYANYTPDSGSILIRHGGVMIDLVSAPAQTVLHLREHTLGYVSQFLRVIPRIPTLTLVAEPLLRQGFPEEQARSEAARILARLRIPEKLLALSPLTFSGGEQQRVNIARGFIQNPPILLLDEPTASLDPENTRTVVELIHQAKNRGAAIVGIFHDPRIRSELADRMFEMSALKMRLQKILLQPPEVSSQRSEVSKSK